MRNFLVFQLTQITEANRAGVSITLVVSIAVALRSVSGGMAALVTGINVAHEADEPKSFVAKRGKALALTLGAVIVLVVLVWLWRSSLPSSRRQDSVTPGGSCSESCAGPCSRPDGPRPQHAVPHRCHRSRGGATGLARGLITPGAIAGTGLWLVVSVLFSFYTANFSSYSKTYGTLASIVVVLLWLFLSALAVLIGAEVDASRASDQKPEHV